MNRSFSLVLSAALAFTAMAPLMAQVSRLQLGLMLDRDGMLRPVTGVPASSTLGDGLIDGVLSAGCSAQLCLAKTDGALMSWVSSTGSLTSIPAAKGPALFAFAGASALVYFSSTQTLAAWNNGALSSIPANLSGEVLALRVSGDGFDYAIRRNISTSLEHFSLANGNVSVLAELGATGPIALPAGSVVQTIGNSAQLVRDDGSTVLLPISNVQGYTWLGENYLQAATSDANWIIRTETRREQAFLLPGSPAPGPRSPAKLVKPRPQPWQSLRSSPVFPIDSRVHP